MAPCVLMIDEVEKAFSGVNGSGDSGVSSRMFGTFLSWLNDHTSDVFVVCTSNDMSKLPPEFGRSERFDGIFFLDLPGQEEKDAIWGIYLDLFAINQQQAMPDDTDWTGAEIKACCRLAALLDVSLLEASQNVVPVAVTASESVERLRTWASANSQTTRISSPVTTNSQTSTERKTQQQWPQLNPHPHDQPYHTQSLLLPGTRSNTQPVESGRSTS